MKKILVSLIVLILVIVLTLFIYLKIINSFCFDKMYRESGPFAPKIENQQPIRVRFNGCGIDFLSEKNYHSTL